MNNVDHIIYTVPELERAVARLEEDLGVRPTVGGRHPDLGTWNALLALGPGTYLEIMAPDPDASVRPGDRPFGIDDLETGRLATWSARHPDPAAAVEAVRDLGVELGEPAPGSRDAPDGRILTWRITDPFTDRLGGVVPFLIDWGDTPHPATSAPQGVRLVEFAVRHPRPDEVRRILVELDLEVPVERASEPGLAAILATPAGRATLE